MMDPYLIEDSWKKGVKDRERQLENNVSELLKTCAAVAQAIENTDGMTSARRIQAQS